MSARREYEMFFRLAGGLDANFTTAFRNASSEMRGLQTSISTVNTRLRDVSAYQSQIRAIERQNEQIRTSEQRLERLRERHRELAEQMQNTTNPSARLRSQFQRNEEQIRSCESSIESQNDSLREMNTELENSRTALQNAGIDTDNLTESTERLQRQLRNLSDTRGFLSNVSQELRTAQNDFKDSLTGFGELAGGIAATGGTVYAATSKPAIDFESAFAGVRKTVDASEEEFETLRQGILDLSQTDVAASASEIAAVAEAAGQLGIQKDNVLDFSKVMIDLGESTNLSAEDAASQLAKFANITKMDPANYQKLGSVIVDLGNNFATTEADIVGMGTRLASTGELTGLTEPQIMAVATALSSLGIEEEAGGTAMSKLLKMFQLANERGDMEEYAKTAGMTAEAFSDLYKQDSLKAISAWTQGLNDVERNGKSAIEILDDMDIKEVRLSNAILAMAASDDILTEAAGRASAAWEDNTALTEEAEKRYSTTQSQIDMTKNAVENLGVTIGDLTLPAIQDMAQGLNEAARHAQRWVKENPETIKQITEVAGEAAKYALILKGSQVVYNGVRVGTLGAIKGVTKLKAAFQAAGAAASGSRLSTFTTSLTGISAGAASAAVTVGGIVAVIAALSAAIYLNHKEFLAARKEYMDSKLFNNGLPKLEDYTKALKENTEQYYKYSQEVNEAAEELSNIEYEMSKAKDSVELYNQILEENGTLTKDQAEAMYEPFNELVGKLEDDFKGRYDIVFKAFSNTAANVAQDFGVSISEITGTLESFKARFSESTSEAQREVNALLEKQRNGEPLTDDDWQTFNKKVEYITAMSDTKSESLADFNEQKQLLGGMDLGKDTEDSYNQLNTLVEYANNYLNEIDAAQKTQNRENDSLREQAALALEYGEFTPEEYAAYIKALNTAQGIVYENYIRKRNEFTESISQTVDDTKKQIKEAEQKSYDERKDDVASQHWLGNLQGTLAGYEAYITRMWQGQTSGEDPISIAKESADAFWSTQAEVAHEKTMESIEGIYSDIKDKVNELNSTAEMPAVSIPVEVEDLRTELLNSVQQKTTGPFVINGNGIGLIKYEDLPGHASGTSFTENAFIAGENGPELITGAPGRTVFTAGETRTIFGLLPQAAAVISAAGRGDANITINSSPVFNISGGEDAQSLFEKYNQSLAEKIAEVLDERYENVRRNAYSY